MEKFFASKAFPILTLTILVLGLVVWLPELESPQATLRFGIE